jgi:hypothetical protein
VIDALGAVGCGRSRLGLLALVAALVAAFVLALPAGASAFSLTVHKAGTGKGTVQCEIAGTGTTGTCASSYPAGTELVLYATPNLGSIFVGWTDENCSFYEAEPCELILEKAVTVVAEFGPIPKYPLTVEIEGSGSGTVECEVAGSGSAGPCAAEYPEGTELNLYATPGPGSVFVGWTDGYCSFYGAEPCEELRFEEEGITVDAEFGLIPKYPLTVEIEGSGTGTVKCEVAGSGSAGSCAAEYPEGATLSLYATPGPGSVFVGWSGECDVAVASKCEVEMSEEKTVAAVFEARPQVPFTVIESGTGTGTVTCDGGACASSYSEGKEVTLAASAAAGSTFGGWSGGGCSGTGSCTVTIKAGMTVTATFNVNPTPPPESEGVAKAARSAKVSGRNAVLKLTCSGGPCKGTLKLTAKVRQGGRAKRALVGKASFSLAARASKTLKVRLSAAARKELVKDRVLKATVSGTGIAGSTVRLKLGR